MDTGDTIVSGADNTYLGRHADASGNNVSYENVLGSGQTGYGSNTTVLRGNTYNSSNNSTFSTTSDIRIKKNIVDNNTGLDKINQIQVKNFEYRKPEEVDSTLSPDSAIDKEGIQLGVIAQEIEQILPDLVKTETTGCKSVNTDNLTWYLVNAVKELSARVQELESRQ